MMRLGSDKKSRARALVGYVRVSTDEQAASGLSLLAQTARIRDYARALGYKIVAVEQDAVSGKMAPAKRPGFGRVLDAIKGGRADGLIAYKLDRISRSTLHILKLADEAKRRGWQLLSVTEQLDSSTACGEFVLVILAGLAQMERRQIAERTKLGMEQIAREGRARSWKIPFGFRIEGEPTATTLRAGDRRPLVKHPGEQKLLQEILRLRVTRRGRFPRTGPMRIARVLNERGLPNPRTRKPWNYGTVAGILRTDRNRKIEAETARSRARTS